MRLAHSLALVSAQITADMVEAIEFPQLAEKYHVQGVPRTVINEDTSVEGAVPEPIFVAKVLQALGMMTEAEVQKMVDDSVAAAEAAAKKG